MLFYVITDRRLLVGSEEERRGALAALVRKWVRGGVDYIQIREKDLAPGELLKLARQVIAAARVAAGSGAAQDIEMRNMGMRNIGGGTRILLNGPPEIALEAGADGVHLTGKSAPGAAAAVQAVYERAGRRAILSRSCHTLEEAGRAGADSLVLFGPVFEKPLAGGGALSGRGLEALGEACRAGSGAAVLALGGVTAANAHRCIEAGASGVAGIRLFLGEEWRRLRDSGL
jgi:thiamine-phosphate pyrophosphorylase